MWKKIASFIIVCSLIVLSSETTPSPPLLRGNKGGKDSLPVRQAHDVLEYWKRPIPIQSQIPLTSILSPEGKGKDEGLPEGCGECHKEQYKGWKGSLHSKAVGPGLLSQIDPHNNPETALSCYYCHAPMMEQSEVKKQSPAASLPVRRQTGHQSPVKNNNYIKNPSFDSKLKFSGVSCAVCHLRGGKVYGPPAKTVTSHQSPVTSNKRPHNFIEMDFFESAEFCAACHQLDEGYELNGKVLTNTYREWKESIYGEDNITCQSCHMPDRQHLWRGIHDPEMVQGGIHIEVIPHEKGGRLVITNTAVGHFFPTYVTPLIIIKGFMMDKKGKVIPSSVKEAYIGRKVSLDLETEVFDTRIAPKRSFEFDYKLEGKDKSLPYKLVFEVWVYPDEFYNRFYKAMIDDNTVKGGDIKEAIMTTEKTGYKLFRKEVEIGL